MYISAVTQVPNNVCGFEQFQNKMHTFSALYNAAMKIKGLRNDFCMNKLFKNTMLINIHRHIKAPCNGCQPGHPSLQLENFPFFKYSQGHC